MPEAEIAGIRAFAVHAKDEEVRRFYLKFGFIPSPSDPMHSVENHLHYICMVF